MRVGFEPISLDNLLKPQLSIDTIHYPLIRMNLANAQKSSAESLSRWLLPFIAFVTNHLFLKYSKKNWFQHFRMEHLSLVKHQMLISFSQIFFFEEAGIQISWMKHASWFDALWMKFFFCCWITRKKKN